MAKLTDSEKDELIIQLYNALRDAGCGNCTGPIHWAKRNAALDAFEKYKGKINRED